MITGIVERMAGLTGQLKIFARKSTDRSERLPVARCLANALALVHRRIAEEGVSVVRAPEAPQAEVLGDPNRIEQVLVNLLGNALDALQGRSDPRIRITTEVQGHIVRIAVADNGPGLAEALPRLFEPFFTTKVTGLGLGLTISEGIVREQGGVLRASDRAEGGAEFVIELRRAPDSAAGEGDA